MRSMIKNPHIYKCCRPFSFCGNQKNNVYRSTGNGRHGLQRKRHQAGRVGEEWLGTATTPCVEDEKMGGGDVIFEANGEWTKARMREWAKAVAALMDREA